MHAGLPQTAKPACRRNASYIDCRCESSSGVTQCRVSRGRCECFDRHENLAQAAVVTDAHYIHDRGSEDVCLCDSRQLATGVQAAQSVPETVRNRFRAAIVQIGE